MTIDYEKVSLRSTLRMLIDAIDPLKVNGTPVTQLDSKLASAMRRAKRVLGPITEPE